MTTRRHQEPRAVYTLRLVPQPGVDAVKALRAALKTLLRRHGLRCTSIKQDEVRR
jgi:hypothetical protein